MLFRFVWKGVVDLQVDDLEAANSEARKRFDKAFPNRSGYLEVGIIPAAMQSAKRSKKRSKKKRASKARRR